MSDSSEKSSGNAKSSLSIWLTIFSTLIFCLSVVYAIAGVALIFEQESVEYGPYMMFSVVPAAIPFCFCNARFSKVWGAAAGLAIAWMLGLEIFVGLFF